MPGNRPVKNCGSEVSGKGNYGKVGRYFVSAGMSLVVE